jgi:hypothetical protein
VTAGKAGKPWLLATQQRNLELNLSTPGGLLRCRPGHQAHGIGDCNRASSSGAMEYQSPMGQPSIVMMHQLRSFDPDTYSFQIGDAWRSRQYRPPDRRDRYLTANPRCRGRQRPSLATVPCPRQGRSGRSAGSAAAGRRAIAEAARRRWAAIKKAAAPAARSALTKNNAPQSRPAPKKRRTTAAGRKAMADAAKRRWADAKSTSAAKSSAAAKPA